MTNRSSQLQPREDDPDYLVRRFIEELSEPCEGEHVLFGMVRSAGGQDGLMFTHLGGCGEWIHIPPSSIAAIDRGTYVPCRGHHHLTARIRLKPPQTERELTFAKVASLHLSRLHQLAAGTSVDVNGCGKDQHVVTDASGVQRCVDNQPHGPFGGID